jgi:hypothetical protein
MLERNERPFPHPTTCHHPTKLCHPPSPSPWAGMEKGKQFFHFCVTILLKRKGDNYETTSYLRTQR